MFTFLNPIFNKLTAIFNAKQTPPGLDIFITSGRLKKISHKLEYLNKKIDEIHNSISNLNKISNDSDFGVNIFLGTEPVDIKRFPYKESELSILSCFRREKIFHFIKQMLMDEKKDYVYRAGRELERYYSKNHRGDKLVLPYELKSFIDKIVSDFDKHGDVLLSRLGIDSLSDEIKNFVKSSNDSNKKVKSIPGKELRRNYRDYHSGGIVDPGDPEQFKSPISENDSEKHEQTIKTDQEIS